MATTEPRRTRVLRWLAIGAALLVGVAVALDWARTAGREQAIADRESFRRGCSVPQSKPCVDVLRGGNVIGTGFVIAESENAVAFYDVETHEVRQLEKSGGAVTLRPR